MINIHEAQKQLSKPIEDAKAGEEINIARTGKPVRKPGAMKGKFIVPESFFDPLPQDILDYFEGKADEDPALTMIE